MKTVAVKLGERSYRIRIDAGLLDEAGALAREAIGDKARQAVIVTNPAVENLYGERVARSINRAGLRTRRFLIGDGERYKTLRTAESLLTDLIQQRIERCDSRARRRCGWRSSGLCRRNLSSRRAIHSSAYNTSCADR
jgi:3-dehydroquinate synthase